MSQDVPHRTGDLSASSRRAGSSNAVAATGIAAKRLDEQAADALSAYNDEELDVAARVMRSLAGLLDGLGK